MESLNKIKVKNIDYGFSSCDILFKGDIYLWDCDTLEGIKNYKEENIQLSEILRNIYNNDYKFIYLEYYAYTDSFTSADFQTILRVIKSNGSVHLEAESCTITNDGDEFLLTRIYELSYDLSTNKVSVDVYYGNSLENELLNPYYNYDLTNDTITGQMPEESNFEIYKIIGIK